MHLDPRTSSNGPRGDTIIQNKTRMYLSPPSPSVPHMGQYKTLLECIHKNGPTIPDLIGIIAEITLLTALPFDRWQKASKVMLEKGKGWYISFRDID